MDANTATAIATARQSLTLATIIPNNPNKSSKNTENDEQLINTKEQIYPWMTEYRAKGMKSNKRSNLTLILS
jgi:hypothetical protein